MNKKIVIAAAFLLFSAVSAPAADRPVNWTGIYVGGHAGYLFGKSTATDVGDVFGFGWNALGDQFSATPDGFTGGVQLGVNVQNGMWVWGIEMDYSRAHARAIGELPNVAGTYLHSDISSYATFRGRLGVTSGRTLYYLTGGAIRANANSQIELQPPLRTLFSPEMRSQWGWTIGAGLEWALSPQWSVKGEYLFYDLGSETVSVTGACNVACNFRIENTGSIVRLGLNYRFGR